VSPEYFPKGAIKGFSYRLAFKLLKTLFTDALEYSVEKNEC
jgi:hypothetical protein